MNGLSVSNPYTEVLPISSHTTNAAISAEIDRLISLHHYEILDTPPDAAFDRIVALAAYFFKVPICLISLVDENRIWFKARYGLAAEQIPRIPGFCASVILSDQVYVVEHARTDPRTQDNPLVVGDLGLQFYAASPLITPDGHRLGTLNIIDVKPRSFDPAHAQMLQHFAGLVMDQMELRLAVRKTTASLVHALTQAQQTDTLEEFLTVCAWTHKIKVGDSWVSFGEFLAQRLGIPITHGMHPDIAQQWLKKFE
jgi:hypothetical protein